MIFHLSRLLDSVPIARRFSAARRMQQVSALTSRRQDETRGRYAARCAIDKDKTDDRGGNVRRTVGTRSESHVRTRETWPAHDFGPSFSFPAARTRRFVACRGARA